MNIGSGTGMSKTKKKKFKHHGRPAGMTLMDEITKRKLVYQGVEKTATDVALKIKIDRSNQKALWLAIVAVNDAYGFGSKRIQPFINSLLAVSNEYQKMKTDNDEEYADEKLRMKIEEITGTKIDYLYEDEMNEAHKRYLKEVNYK